MDVNVLAEEAKEQRGKRVRSWTYWGSAIAATLFFLLITAVMLTVPGITSSVKVWMLSLAGLSLAVSLGVGMWRFGSTDAPATLWPGGPIMGVVLLLELADCVINVFLLSAKAHP